ncbi:hypothetical protein [Cellulomonas cellasea]|uniref:Uncharacterized protein n=1 Tax=Cellulomonas cellasea TaxID=43670 RepID=A0A7W4UH29_9CELL|nr:hypothetical protein [Cellulomonas cellasea]MBB2923689.1 hypothetical protein [Cellulomonas cellasea]
MTRDLRSVLDDFGESSGRELSRRAPDPAAQVRDVTRRVVRRRLRSAAAAVGGVAAILLVGGLMTHWALAPQPVPPAVDGSPDATAAPSPTSTRSPTPTPSRSSTAVPSPASTTPPAVLPPERPVLVLGPGGAVDHLGAGADVDAVTAHLTELFAGPPEDTTPSLCPAGEGLDSLRWGNFSLLVRADTGTVVGADVSGLAPQGPGWDGPWRAVDVRTTAGIRVGDPFSSVRAAYPDLRGPGNRTIPEEAPPYFWSTGTFPDSYSFVAEGTDPELPVTGVVSGYDCGE